MATVDGVEAEPGAEVGIEPIMEAEPGTVDGTEPIMEAEPGAEVGIEPIMEAEPGTDGVDVGTGAACTAGGGEGGVG